MKAVRWHGKGDVRVEDAPDPRIEDSEDCIVKITSTAICGSDLHLFDGFAPGMKSGDIIGHEPMGEVVETGRACRNLKVGDRVVVPFTISCGRCWFCEHTLYSLCDNSNPNADEAAKTMGQSPAGLYGYTHLLGGFPGGQAEYLRVPYANCGPVKIPDGIPDEQVLFLSDIFPTGYMAAEHAEIEPGDTVAIWGCGPVGQFAIQSAWMLGAGRVIAIDRVPERLRMAEHHGRAETIDTSEKDVYETLMEMTKGRGPDRCIDAVGAEAHASSSVVSALDKGREALHMEMDKPYVLQEIVKSCRKGGTVSIPGVYFSMTVLPIGPLMNKGLTVRTGQTHVQRYLEPLLKKIVDGDIDPSFVITHKVALADAPQAYKTFRDKDDGCIKVVLKP